MVAYLFGKDGHFLAGKHRECSWLIAPGWDCERGSSQKDCVQREELHLLLGRRKQPRGCSLGRFTAHTEIGRRPSRGTGSSVGCLLTAGVFVPAGDR